MAKAGKKGSRIFVGDSVTSHNSSGSDWLLPMLRQRLDDRESSEHALKASGNNWTGASLSRGLLATTGAVPREAKEGPHTGAPKFTTPTRVAETDANADHHLTMPEPPCLPRRNSRGVSIVHSLPGAFAHAPGENGRRRPNIESQGVDLDISEIPPDRDEIDEAGTSVVDPEGGNCDNNSGLVEAVPVVDDDDDQILVEAREHHQTSRPNRRRTWKDAMLLTGCCLGMIAVATVSLSVTLTSNVDAAAAASATETISMSPTSSPVAWSFELPDYTRATIIEDPSSAQSKAYQWLQDDPAFDSYPEARKLQRFALATLFFATSGGGWVVRNDWLSYESHECYDWFDQAYNIGFDPCPEESNDVYKALVLSSNHLMGTIPPELGLLSSLEILVLSDNTLVGSIPRQLWKMTLLKLFALDANQLTGTLPPDYLPTAKSIVRLDLSDNRLNGSLPTEVGLLTACNHLALNDNLMTGAIPTTLRRMTDLEHIALSANSLSGSIPAAMFSHWGKLTHLELRDNPLTGILPTEIGLLTELKECFLYYSQLSGQIPSEIGRLTDLTHFIVTGNNISGSLPTELWQLTQLQELLVYDNEISGTLAAEVGQLTALRRLYVGVNDITGTIPSSMELLTNLRQLHLNSNIFSGSIPSSVWFLEALEEMRLDGNDFTGSIPATTTSETLEMLNLTNTLLSGTIPNHLCYKAMFDFACSNSLCGCECQCHRI